MTKNTREWVIGVGMLFFAALSVYTGCQTAYVADRVGEAETRGENHGHDAVQDVEIAAVKGWQTNHDTRTGPMIDRFLAIEPQVARLPEMERTLTETAGLVREMHSFLVERYAMPTSFVMPPPYDGPVITALPRRSPPAGGGVIAAEIP